MTLSIDSLLFASRSLSLNSVCHSHEWQSVDDWSDWPSLPRLFPASFPGVKTSRDSFLVDVDRPTTAALRVCVTDYFNPELSHEENQRRTSFR